ncbi:MAG TPA: signal peptide peptidase SppA [Alphaproteobacteria bacterium]|nr:signal peptide peptidase SppA [Alphaproteobacteria bacterium]
MARSGANVTSNDTFALIWLDRSRRRWRLLAVLLLLVFGMATCSWMGDWKDEIETGPHIAVITIDGMITDDAYARQVIEQLADEKDVKGVLVNVDSPGGTMVGGLRLYDALRTVAVKKPVATVMGTLAASAGYMVSLAGDRIYANPATLTGSIGVLMPLVDATALADKIGIKEDAFTSGDLKEVTSPLARRDPRARAYLQELVMRMDEVFMALVKTRRPNLSAATLHTIADGRALAGVQALDMKLVDELGGEADAQKWLSAQAQGSKGGKDLLELHDYDLTEEKGWLSRALESQLHLSGLMGRLTNMARTNMAVMAVAR